MTRGRNCAVESIRRTLMRIRLIQSKSIAATVA
jgi:hypothetical protein